MLALANVVALSTAYPVARTYWNGGGWWGLWWIWIVLVVVLIALFWGGGTYYRGGRPYGRRRTDRMPPTV